MAVGALWVIYMNPLIDQIINRFTVYDTSTIERVLEKKAEYRTMINDVLPFEGYNTFIETL